MASNSELEAAGKELFFQGNSKETRATLETLIKIFRNVAQNPAEEKYRRLRISNSKFFKDIWRHNGPRRFLLKAGWKVNGAEVIFEDSSKLNEALKILLSVRMISPCTDEWTGEVVQGLSKLQLRELELKEKAIKQREKEIAEHLESKKERKRIAECVKAEHIADRKRVELLRPSVIAGEAKECPEVPDKSASSSYSQLGFPVSSQNSRVIAGEAKECPEVPDKSASSSCNQVHQ